MINKEPIDAKQLTDIFDLKPPLDGLSFFDAKKIAGWMGVRLLTEEEWKLAFEQGKIV